MTQQAEPSRVVASRVRQVRERRGWTGERLGQELTKIGIPWNRSVVANFESGRRTYVSVDELLALAYVLDVAPIHLLVPVEDGPYQPAPTVQSDSESVRDWIRGRRELPGQVARIYFDEMPEKEYLALLMPRLKGRPDLELLALQALQAGDRIPLPPTPEERERLGTTAGRVLKQIQEAIDSGVDLPYDVVYDPETNVTTITPRTDNGR